jgi:AcrR family transcriptional regulator
MPTSPKKAPRGEALHAQVLDTALRLFSQRGYFNTSIHDIRREAGVSIGAIYHHFANKESLAKALYDDLLLRLEGALSDILNSHATCHKRCDAIIAFMFDMAEQAPEMMRFILDAKHREFMPAEKPLCSSRPFELMRHCVEGGIKSGAVRPLDPWVATTAAFGGAIRMIQLHLDGVLEQPLGHYLAQTQDSAWRAIRI